MKRSHEKAVKPIFYSMIGIFVLIVLFFALPMLQDMGRRMFAVAAVLGFIWLILGVWLIVLAVKLKMEKKRKVFLILMGASAIGVPLGSILHNVFYAFGVLAENIAWLHAVFEFIHAAFFLIAMLGCPILFLVGAVGAFVMMRKKR